MRKKKSAAAVNIKWSSEPGVFVKAQVMKNGRKLSDIPARVIKNKSVYSHDKTFLYLLGEGLASTNGIWQINLLSGDVRVFEPRYLTKLESWDKGIIAKWAEGEYRIKVNDFKSPPSKLKKLSNQKATALKPGAAKLFALSAPYYQFFIVLDDDSRFSDELEAAAAQTGFAVLEGHVILVRTTAHSNYYPVSISLNPKRTEINPSSTSEFEINLQNGFIHIYSLSDGEYEGQHFKVTQGKYLLRASCFHEGVEPSKKMSKLKPADFAKEKNVEHYKIELIAK